MENSETGKGNSLKPTVTIDREHYKMLLSAYNGFRLGAKGGSSFNDALLKRIQLIGETAGAMSAEELSKEIDLMHLWKKYMTLE